MEGGLLGDAPPWTAVNHLGSIAGTLNIGFGLLFPGMLEPSDGMITVVETQLPGMADHICLLVSHMQMLVEDVYKRQQLAAMLIYASAISVGFTAAYLERSPFQAFVVSSQPIAELIDAEPSPDRR